MRLFADVFSNYLADKNSGMVPSSNDGAPKSVYALRVEWPDLLRSLASGASGTRFLVEGSAGQINLNWAGSPYVATLDPRITKSTKRGYYIVLLFKGDMSGAYLVLAQGFGQYSAKFPSANLAHAKIRESTWRIKNLLTSPAGFSTIPIDLRSNSDLAKGYEEGTIFSKQYSAINPPSEAAFAADYLALIKEYEFWFDRFGVDLPATTTTDSEVEFQNAAAGAAEAELEPETSEKEDRPPKSNRKGSRTGYSRDPRRAGIALKAAGFQCEADASHRTFVHASSKNNFVEAHHLVPMSYQDAINARLDVSANIIALCPNCHRHIHHGHGTPRAKLIDTLFAQRQLRLAEKGISISLKELKSLYKHLEWEE